MKIVTRHPKLGDALLTEPAIAAYHRHTGVKAEWCLPEPVRSLLAGHPEIVFTDDPTGGIELSATEAMLLACREGRYFTSAYFDQVLGYPPSDHDRLRIRTGCPFLFQPVGGGMPEVVIVPFAASCASLQGEMANIMPPLHFWRDIVQAFPEVACLASPEWPDIPGAVNLRDLTLVEALSVLAYAKVVITVETGLLHLASSVTDRVIYLSCATPVSLCTPPDAIGKWTIFHASRTDMFPVHLVIDAAKEYL